MQGNNVLLSVENLKVYYELRRFGLIHAGYVKAVDGVSFTLNKGEALSIVGESGCGKTTLAKTILGLVRPSAGRVIFEGNDITQLDGKNEAFGIPLKWGSYSRIHTVPYLLL